jgi:rhodanese-related sulfurtransferase
MNVKSIQTLVSEAMQEIKTISADEALKKFEANNCNLIDIREVRELRNYWQE